MQSEGFKAFRLLDDPFYTTPDTSKPLPWAGNEEYKKEIENTIKVSLVTSPSRIIINHGEWGMGKTHALRYFTDPKNLGELCKQVNRKVPLAIDLILPRKGVFNSLYIDIINSIGIERIKEVIKRIQSNLVKKKIALSQGSLHKEINSIIQNDKLSKVLSFLVEGKKETVERYLLLNARNKDLDELKVPMGIVTTTDILNTLKGIFNILIRKTENIEPEYSKIFIWIDQTENITDFSGKEIIEIQEFLRDIMDMVPSNLVIFLNYSSRPDQIISDFLTYLGDAVVMRIYKRIHIPEMSEDDAMSYIKEVLNNEYNRLKSDIELCKANPYFPFDEATLRYLLKRIKENRKYLSPRWINDFLSGILQVSFEDETLMLSLSKMERVIGREIITKNEDKIIFTSGEES